MKLLPCSNFEPVSLSGLGNVCKECGWPLNQHPSKPALKTIRRPIPEPTNAHLPPDRIWLQWHGDAGPEDAMTGQAPAEVSWSATKVFQNDIEYDKVSAEGATKSEIREAAEPTELYKLCQKIESKINDWLDKYVKFHATDIMQIIQNDGFLERENARLIIERDEAKAATDFANVACERKDEQITRLKEHNDVLLKAVKFVIYGIQKGAIKSKPILDMSDPNAEEFPMVTLEEQMTAAIADAERET